MSSWAFTPLLPAAAEELGGGAAPPPAAPVFTVSQADTSAASGTTTTFTAAASGSPTPTLRVQRFVAGLGSSEVSDTFDRADGALGADWTVPFGSASISSNAISFGWADTVVRYEGRTFAADQEASFLVTGAFGEIHCGGAVRLQSNGAGYICSNETEAVFVQISRSNGGGSLTGLANITGLTLVPGDRIGLRAIGSTISVTQNGVVVGSVTDGTYATGQPGGYGFFGVAQAWFADDFAGGAPEWVDVDEGTNFTGPSPLTYTTPTLDGTFDDAEYRFAAVNASGEVFDTPFTLTVTAGLEGAAGMSTGPATLVALASLPIAGSAVQTTQGASMSGAGVLPVTGLSGASTAPASLAAVGVLSLQAVAAQTIAGASLAATGVLSIRASATMAAGAAIMAGQGVLPVDGVAASALSGASLSAAGVLPIAGAAAMSAGAAVMDASGTIGSAVSGAAGMSTAPASLAASGSLPIAGAAVMTTGAAALDASALLPLSASAAMAAGAAVMAAQGSQNTTGQAGMSTSPAVLVAAGSLPLSGAAIMAAGGATMAAAGSQPEALEGAAGMSTGPALMSAQAVLNIVGESPMFTQGASLSSFANMGPVLVESEAESQRYRIIAQRIERGQVDGPDAHLFLRVGLRSKYRGM